MRTFSIQVNACRLCPRPALEPRRGLCRGCYLREYRGTALPEGAACVCGVSNPITLVKCKGGGVRCYNCRALERAATAGAVERPSAA
jgi:hypothetical protein